MELVCSTTGVRLGAGDRLLVAALPGAAQGHATADVATLAALRAGMLLGHGQDAPLVRVVEAGFAEAEGGGAMVRCARLEVLADWDVSGPIALRAWKDGLSLAWVTLSDKGAAGLREDASGPRIEALARQRLAIGFARGYLLPDDEWALRALLTDLALVQGFDVIVTTGGTGVGPRDVTPEATLAVIEKRLPGFEQAMMAASLAKTPHGAISRAVAGTVGNSLVLNMPGSVKAVTENLEAVLPAVAHCVAKLQGDPADCGA